MYLCSGIAKVMPLHFGLNSVLLLFLVQKTAKFQRNKTIGTKRLRIAWGVLICYVGMAVPLNRITCSRSLFIVMREVKNELN